MLNDKSFIKKVDFAIEEAQNLLEIYPDHKPFEVLLDQLKFIRSYSMGTTSNDNKLKAVDLSYIIAKEVDHINHDLAEQLSEIHWEVRKFRGDNIYKM